MGFKKEDIDRIKDIEREILSLEINKHGIKYTPDIEMEIEIKESVLIDKFGKDRVLDAMNKLGIDKKSLFDQDKYILLTKFLQGEE